MPFVKRHRTYYKYVWEDYSLPKMTSNTTPEGKLTHDIGIGGPYATNIYPVFFGGGSININGLYNRATRYLRYTFAKILKAGKYTFTYAAYRQNNVTNNLNEWEAILEDDSRVEIMNPTITTSTQTFTAKFEVDKPIKAINLTLYASAPAEASCYYIITKIALTGEGLAENTVKAAEVVAGTSTDHDYYVDSNKLYQLAKVKRRYAPILNNKLY